MKLGNDEKKSNAKKQRGSVLIPKEDLLLYTLLPEERQSFV